MADLTLPVAGGPDADMLDAPSMPGGLAPEAKRATKRAGPKGRLSRRWTIAQGIAERRYMLHVGGQGKSTATSTKAEREYGNAIQGVDRLVAIPIEGAKPMETGFGTAIPVRLLTATKGSLC